MRTVVRHLLAVSAAALVTGAAPGAAESPAGGDPAAAPPGLTMGERPSVAPAEDWTRNELAALAHALTGMGAVMREGRQALIRAEDDAARNAIQEEIFVGLLLAVENAGLTYERYNALVAAMNGDPDMRAEVEALLASESAAADPTAPAEVPPADAPPADHAAPTGPAAPSVEPPAVREPAAEPALAAPPGDSATVTPPATPDVAPPPAVAEPAEPSIAEPPPAPGAEPPPVAAGEPESETGLPSGLPPPIPTGELDPQSDAGG